MGQGPSGLAARETVQLLLTFVCLVGYTLAIGSLAGRRGRVVAGTAALLAAIGLVAGAPSWEAGLMLVAWLPIGIGLFAAAAWCLWNATEWHVAEVRCNVEDDGTAATGASTDLRSAILARAPGHGCTPPKVAQRCTCRVDQIASGPRAWQTRSPRP